MPTEDEIYRSSTQYRLWSFTPQRLAGLRSETNALAKSHVRAAIKRKRKRATMNAVIPNGDDDEVEDYSQKNGGSAEVDFLTVEEEKTLVDFFCLQLMNMANLDIFKFPTNVTATAIQFIKRFYLTNSTMSYHPREIMTTALFLATKTENHHTPLRTFAEKLASIPGLEKVTADDILAPEYVLTQGLRFCFDVRHPHRALKGAYLELMLLLKVAKGDYDDVGGDGRQASGPAWQKALLQRFGTPAQVEKAMDSAYMKARDTLQGPAMLSDAYFHHSPSHMMLAALYSADARLTHVLLDFKFGVPPSADVSSRPHVLAKVLSAVADCADLLLHTSFDDKELKTAATRVDRKLHFCRNPEKMDLLGLNRAQKRDKADEEGRLDESLAKKRKLEREEAKREADDLFGPSLLKAE